MKRVSLTIAQNLSRGFSLIELMVTTLILSVGLLALGGGILWEMKYSKQAELRMEAALVSQQLLAHYRAAIPANAVSASRQGFAYTMTPSAQGGAVYLKVVLTGNGLRTAFENQTVVFP